MKIARVFALLVFLLSACGPAAPKTSFTVSMTDFAFTPNVFTVPAGAEITMKGYHDGAVVHDFIIMKFGADIGDTFTEEDRPNVYWEFKLNPGGEETTSFIAPSEPGEYQILCGTAGHLQAGMVGKLIVVAP